MPACGMHMLFGEEVKKKYYSNELEKILTAHRGVYYIGTQGPDIFYYNVFMLFGSKEKNIGSRMHGSHVNAFFSVMLQNILREKNPEVMEIKLAYFIGFTTHYVLDSVVHPYVYARTEEEFEKKGIKISTLGYHQRMESIMDKKMVWKKKKIKPSSFILNKRIQISKKEEEVLAKFLSECVTSVYKIRVSRQNVRGSLFFTRLIFSQICTHFDMKRKLLRKIECPVFHDGMLSNLLVSDGLPDTMDAMNHRKQEWKNTVTGKVNTTSVEQLYQNALEEYGSIGEKVAAVYEELVHIREGRRKEPWLWDDEYAYEQIGKEVNLLLSIMGNKSYHNGETIEKG